MTRKWTIGLLISIAVVLIAWDIFVAINNTPDDTVSEVLLFVSKHPIIPFSFGVINGHLFWPQNRQ